MTETNLCRQFAVLLRAFYYGDDNTYLCMLNSPSARKMNPLLLRNTYALVAL